MNLEVVTQNTVDCQKKPTWNKQADRLAETCIFGVYVANRSCTRSKLPLAKLIVLLVLVKPGQRRKAVQLSGFIRKQDI